MKLTNVSKLIMLGLALSVATVGCKKKPANVTNLYGTRPKVGQQQPQQQEDFKAIPFNPAPPVIAEPNQPIPPNNPADRANWIHNADALKAQSVYFDIDKSSIRGSEQSKLHDVADYLKNNPNAAILVEGNCDERGTEEYNRSLGERRALAAREGLVRLGVDPGRIDTISYGEDKPAVPGHDEHAWAKNRRDDFIVLSPP